MSLNVRLADWALRRVRLDDALLLPERERVLRLLIDTISYDGGAGQMAIQWRLAGFGQLAEEIGT